MSQADDKPKLIIDEDWKSQVEREREELRSRGSDHHGPMDETLTWSPSDLAGENESLPKDDLRPQAKSEHTSSSSPFNSPDQTEKPGDRAAEESAGDSNPDTLPPPPPATFPFLVSMLGTQALAAMGQLGDDDGAPPVRLDYAKHYIDMLALVEEKTKGNLATTEYDLLADWLHQLRMTYVNVAKKS